MTPTHKLPWPDGKNGANCDVVFDGHRFAVRDSGDTGFNTGRTRWTVSCLTCGDLIHRGSTSAEAQIRAHLFDKTGAFMQFTHDTQEPTP